MDQRTLRLGLLALFAAGLAATSTTAHGIPSGVHSPNVLDAEHSPEAPRPGDDVAIHLEVENGSLVQEAILTYCRAENYACAQSQEMTRNGSSRFEGVARWDGRFFAEARNVGYKFTLRLVNGSEEHSPLRHYPSGPPALPEGVGIYYWYALPAPSGGVVPGPLALEVLAWVGLVMLVRPKR